MRLTTMFLGGLVGGAMVFAAPPVITTQPTTAPTTSPTTKPTKPAVQIAPEAKPLLEKLDRAYASPQSASLQVKVKGEFDVAGRARQYTLDAVGHTDGEGRFNHDVSGVGRVVQTDDRVIIYDARRNAYGVIEQPPAIRSSEQVAQALSDIFIDENPSLLMLITTEPAKLLERGAKSIDARDGAIVLTSDTEIRTIHLDDAGMIHSMTIDYTPLLKARGVGEVRSAVATLNYTHAKGTSVPPGSFSFDIPSGAVEFRIGSELIRSGDSAATTPDRIKQLVTEQLQPGVAPQPEPATQPASD